MYLANSINRNRASHCCEYPRCSQYEIMALISKQQFLDSFNSWGKKNLITRNKKIEQFSMVSWAELHRALTSFSMLIQMESNPVWSWEPAPGKQSHVRQRKPPGWPPWAQRPLGCYWEYSIYLGQGMIWKSAHRMDCKGWLQSLFPHQLFPLLLATDDQAFLGNSLLYLMLQSQFGKSLSAVQQGPLQ